MVPKLFFFFLIITFFYPGEYFEHSCANWEWGNVVFLALNYHENSQILTLPHLALKHDIYQKVHFLRKEKCAYYLSYATLVRYVAIVGSVLWPLLCRDNVGEFTIFFIHECPYFIVLMPSFGMAYNLHLKYSIKGFIFSYEQLYSSSWKGFMHL